MKADIMPKKRINVELGERSYPIITGSGMASSFAAACRRYRISDTVVIITDRNVARLHLKPLLNVLRGGKFKPLVIVIPAGEEQKKLESADRIYTLMLKKKIPRSAAVIALGGGVIGDLAGFIAATYQRGIKLVQVPTTLLAQVDSSIGGKVGVNHILGKNMIGAFHQPVFVWMDAEYLKTLPKREMICGLGEVIKYGAIWDPGLFAYIERNLEKILKYDTGALRHIQFACAAIKAGIVSMDERESGIRAILNFGHTIGHGLESAGDYKILKHGEAVILGMAGEASIAKKMKMLDANSFEKFLSLIRRIPIRADLKSLKPGDITSAMGRDKKRVDKKLRFILPVKIGKVKIADNVQKKLIQQAVKEILKGN
ncbi:MAG: 3-dehydroquinate synthase [Bacteroidetes bacterium]|nr:3-dehydroquinate synthase [Bacteroidota bacterium]